MEGKDGLGPAGRSVPSHKGSPRKQDSAGRWVRPLAGAGAWQPRFSARKPGPDMPICAHTVTVICPAPATLQLGGLPRTCSPVSPGEPTLGPFRCLAPAAGRARLQGGQNRPALQEGSSACGLISLQPTAWAPSSGARAHHPPGPHGGGLGSTQMTGCELPGGVGRLAGSRVSLLGKLGASTDSFPDAGGGEPVPGPGSRQGCRASPTP